jgi:DNA-binding transcriptional LysR family regulator
VHAGYVDLSFHAVMGNEKWAGLKVIPFKQDPLVAICSCKQELARLRSITLDLLAGEKFVDLTPERGLRKLLDASLSITT